MSYDSQYNGRLTLLFGDEGATIEIRDQPSREVVCEVTLTPEQTCQALSRLGETHCKVKYGELKNVGKKEEYKEFIFEIPSISSYRREDRKTIAKEIVKEVCPEGWEPDLYFGSQDSFFTKDDKKYARTMIRRWVVDDDGA